jgi:hypothetical protein
MSKRKIKWKKNVIQTPIGKRNLWFDRYLP